MRANFLRTLLIGMLAMGIFYVLIVTLFVLSPDLKYHLGGKEFDAIAWQEWNESEAEPSLRWEMTKDLTRKLPLRGMRIEKVIETLGEPDSVLADGTLSYYLGMSGHGIDIGMLSLIVKDGIVVDYDVWHG